MDNDIWDRRLQEHIEGLVAGAPHEFELEISGCFPDVGIQLAIATELLKERGYRFQSAESEGPELIRARFARHEYSCERPGPEM